MATVEEADAFGDVTLEHHTITANGIAHHVVTAGSGPPVYLLHGFPETWFGWRKQIAVLAKTYTVIAPDLRGYGATDKPATGYDKRTMAADVVAIMDALGHEKIALVTHDRGSRVGTRFAKDHPDKLDRLVVMDNIPTRIVAETYDVAKANAGYWFFTFLAVPDLPETLIAGKEREFLTYFYRTWSYNPEMLTPAEIDVYVRAYQQPGTVRGSCADYRAAAEDVAQDEQDLDTLIQCPLLSMWGEDFAAVGGAYDVAAIWQSMGTNVRTVAIPRCGHLCHEERPDVVNHELLEFLHGWTG
ncbi:MULTISPECIES: alpha/beta fold hydrolase [unclassified Rhodococcus (in: high G+C Gram-positive bacteria)]|uniref:alpha/beta fold hydrolase n=1 Tax=unclassified Rhodococcus (in: high G+C Gram-positive bacteria) TaxID=192944 RepID=UPI000B9A93C3|nr:MULTISPECIES: alpha/beta hydrolase [unclassified Rhodococcus (in: high G+C Gram-positive bacteria)]OZD06542.1 alpha/beta hydrolase [Rhodococcus sp. 06-235-1A]OZF42019.1 alpha/beta hydrolase [Rhodococcus sp. 14-2470-1a]